MGETRGYPRIARINQQLREVIAERLEREVDVDSRLEMVTITAVEASSDLRHARVFYSSLGNDVQAALESHRVRLQKHIASQVRLKRTPQLQFLLDPSMEEGWKIERIVAGLHEHHSEIEQNPEMDNDEG